MARVEQKVFAKGVERTNELRELGVPLAPYLERLGERLDALPAESRKKLVELGLAVEETEYEGEKPVVHLDPTWTLKTTYYWDQVFPPGETKIEHRYAPSVGVTLGSVVGSEYVPELLRKADPDEGDRNQIDEFNDHVRTYCLDDGFIQSARRIEKTLPKEGTLIERRISYVLKTAANWSGPIKAFRLVVDKQYPDNLVSFCGQGVRKTGPTTFEMTKTDFTPAEDLSNSDPHHACRGLTTRRSVQRCLRDGEALTGVTCGSEAPWRRGAWRSLRARWSACFSSFLWHWPTRQSSPRLRGRPVRSGLLRRIASQIFNADASDVSEFFRMVREANPSKGAIKTMREINKAMQEEEDAIKEGRAKATDPRVHSAAERAAIQEKFKQAQTLVKETILTSRQAALAKFA